MINSKDFTGPRVQPRWPITYDDTYTNARNSLYPDLSPYQYPIPTVWLAHLCNLWELEGCKEWIARDGLIGLIWFFYRFPSPPKKKVYLYVNKEFSCFVPDAWRGSVGVYSLFTEARKKENFSSKKVVVGVWLSPYSDCNDFLSSISPIQKNAETEWDFFLFPSTGLSSIENSVALLKLGAQLCEKLPGKINFRSHTDFEMTNQMNGALVRHTPPFLVSDSYLLNRALAKGVFLEASLEQKKFFYISPRHGYQLEDRLASTRSSAKEARTALFDGEGYYKHLFGHARHEIFPWPKWMDVLVMNHFKDRTKLGSVMFKK